MEKLKIENVETVNIRITTLCFVRGITISLGQNSYIFYATYYRPIAYGLSGFYFIS